MPASCCRRTFPTRTRRWNDSVRVPWRAARRAAARRRCGWSRAPTWRWRPSRPSYKALVESALRSDWAAALRIGLASHNLFDVAWALCLAEELDANDRVDFEM